MRVRNDISGRRFGNLLVVGLGGYYTPPGGGPRHRQWRSKCDCGNILDVSYSRLKSGKKTCCGCCVQYQSGKEKRNWKGFGEISGTIWSQLRRSAQDRNIAFDLTIEEAWGLFLRQNRECALTGISIGFSPTLRQDISKNTASLDRIDNTKGYMIDNVQWVHVKINYMKSDMSQEEFIIWCKRTVDHFENTVSVLEI